jgi:alpha-ketoglutarate-dependent taurine dioxygenase
MQATQTSNVHASSTPPEIVPLAEFGAEVIDFPRNRALSPGEQIDFTHLFGNQLHTAGPNLRYLPLHPEIFKITNRIGDGNVNTGQYWHSDGHYLQDPSPVTVMHIVSATADGATQVIDSGDAFERLPETVKRYLENLAFMVPETGVIHPIVRKHPVTQRRCLYVNLGATVVNSQRQEFNRVNELIDRYLSEQNRIYEHHWLPGDT